MKHLTHLILGGGGLSCLTYLGILKYLQENDLHTDILHYYGVSMGAFFGFLFALRIPHDILYKELETLFCDPTIAKTPMPSLLDFQTTYGCMTGSLLIEPLKRIYQKLYNESFPTKSYTIDDLTFLDFTKHTGSILTVVATNVTLERPEFFSVETTPNVCIWDAIQASMTIPLVFSPIQIGDYWYVDGVLTCEFPVEPNVIKKLPIESTLGVVMDFRKNNTTTPGLPSLLDYLFKITQLQLFYSKQLYTQTTFLKYICWIDYSPVSVLPVKIHETDIIIDLQPHEMEAAYLYGYNKIQAYVTTFLESPTSPNISQSHQSTEDNTLNPQTYPGQ